MQMDSAITLRTFGPIGLLCIDNPPVNPISENVIDGLDDVVQRFERDGSPTVLVVCAKGHICRRLRHQGVRQNRFFNTAIRTDTGLCRHCCYRSVKKTAALWIGHSNEPAWALHC